ncbi:MAG: mechanosensitive ion channel, partial [Anaerolineae bacterium]|nr:mechanosensitive ion channel [Anaerolineae bacterium]
MRSVLIPGVEIQERFFVSLVFLFLLWLLRLITYQLIHDKLPNDRARYTWRKTSSYIIAFLGLLLLGRIWIQHIQGLATFLGLASAGLAIAMQGPLTDLAGFLLIISRRPFEVGDRIEIDGHAGDVVDIRFLQFTLMEIGNWV